MQARGPLMVVIIWAFRAEADCPVNRLKSFLISTRKVKYGGQ